MFRFATVLQRLGLALAILIAFAAGGSAQQQAPLIGIEPIRASLDQIETAARRGGLGVRALYDLQQTLGPLRDGERGQIKSDTQIAILKRFHAAGIGLSPPQEVRPIGGNSTVSSSPP